MNAGGEPYRFAVLMATRGRPHNLERLHAAIHDTAARPDLVDFWCYVDDDDPAGLDAYQRTEVPARWLSGPRMKLALTWNHLAALAVAEERYSHVLLWGDDVLPETPAWDALIATASDVRGPGFYYGRDGVWDHRPWDEHPEHLVLPTAAAITTDVVQALGYVSPPGLVHLCIDLAWRDLGMAAGMLHYLPEVMIRHLHRVVGAPDDQTYRDANDDVVQKRTDSNAFAAWRHSPRFRRDVERVRGVLEGA